MPKKILPVWVQLLFVAKGWGRTDIEVAWARAVHKVYTRQDLNGAKRTQQGRSHISKREIDWDADSPDFVEPTGRDPLFTLSALIPFMGIQSVRR